LTKIVKRLSKSDLIKKTKVKGEFEKFLSYKEAWARIRLARKSGFYLEAITIEESIISDRLTSFVVKDRGVTMGHKSIRTLNNLTDTWVQICNTNLSNLSVVKDDLQELQIRLNEWRKNRNTAVHGLVKSGTSRDTDHVENFLKLAHMTALEGETLARDISRWVDSARREERFRSKYRTDPLKG
jgi:hypothetical protein